MATFPVLVLTRRCRRHERQAEAERTFLLSRQHLPKPMAEAVFADAVRRHGVADNFGRIDSCGTADYHEGEEPDLR